MQINNSYADASPSDHFFSGILFPFNTIFVKWSNLTVHWVEYLQLSTFQPANRPFSCQERRRTCSHDAIFQVFETRDKDERASIYTIKKSWRCENTVIVLYENCDRCLCFYPFTGIIRIRFDQRCGPKRTARIDLWFAREVKGFSFDIGDSPTVNGYGNRLFLFLC